MVQIAEDTRNPTYTQYIPPNTIILLPPLKTLVLWQFLVF